jgi:uncharacterized membrane protein YdjX (TVP38/TMEM64 family)
VTRPRLIFAGVLVLVFAGAVALLPLKDWSDDLEALIGRLNLMQGLALFCAAYVLATLLLVPAWIFPLVAGAVFGLAWGLAAAVSSATVAALAAFVIARYLARRPVEKAARRYDAFRALERAVAKEPRKIVALLRLSPVIPSAAKSYFLGLTRIRWPDYTLGSAAGMFPGLVLKVYVGATGRIALVEGGILRWSLFAAGVVATIALALILRRAVQRKLGL